MNAQRPPYGAPPYGTPPAAAGGYTASAPGYPPQTTAAPTTQGAYYPAPTAAPGYDYTSATTQETQDSAAAAPATEPQQTEATATTTAPTTTESEAPAQEAPAAAPPVAAPAEGGKKKASKTVLIYSNNEVSPVSSTLKTFSCRVSGDLLNFDYRRNNGRNWRNIVLLQSRKMQEIWIATFSFLHFVFYTFVSRFYIIMCFFPRSSSAKGRRTSV